MAWDYEKIVRDLQDTRTVVVGIQQRQAALVKEHSQMLVDHERFLADHQRLMGEIDGKLNALIQVVDGMIRRNPPG